jgi:hypothetical protein
MDIYKLNFLFNFVTIKAASSYPGRKGQIELHKEFNKNHALIVYSNGIMKYRSNHKVIFSTNPMGEAPFSIDISNIGEFTLSDNKNSILYKSQPWKKYPTIKLTIKNDGRRYEYYNGFPGGSYSIPIEEFSIEVKDYPGIYIKYSIKTHNNDYFWINEKSDGQFLKGKISDFRANLYGGDSYKFKVCYSLLELYKGSLAIGWTRAACDNASSKNMMKDQESYAVAISIFVTDKDDNLPV